MIALLFVGFLALALTALIWAIVHAVDGYEDAAGFHRIGPGDTGFESCRVARRSVSPGRRMPKPVAPRPVARAFFRGRTGR